MVRPSFNRRPSPSRPLPDQMQQVEVERLGDGAWVQSPTMSDELIVTKDITIDPQVLRNMLRERKPAPRTSTPKVTRPESQLIAPEPETRPQEIQPEPESRPTVLQTEAVTATQPMGIDHVDHSYHTHKPESNISELNGVNLSPSVCEDVSVNSASSFQDPSRNYFTNDYSSTQQTETAALGRDLYLRFLHEEMRTVHVREPPSMDPWRAARLDLNYSQSLIASVRIRQSLRQVAEAFSHSEQRERVRERAAKVKIETLDFMSFQDLLFTLFQEGGLTSERVVVLFFFCADLTIRALNEHLTSWFHQLMEWSQYYIVDTVSVWVEDNGGWSAVLDQSTNHIYTAAKIGLVCAAIVALCIFIRKPR